MPLKLATLKRHEDVLAERLNDPAFREEWERLALARTVATRIAAYRTVHDLTQAQLAALLGMHQSAIARLEAGEHNPTVDMLYRLSGRLGIEFVIDIAPPNRRAPSLIRRGAEKTAGVAEHFTTESGSRVLVAAT